MHLFRQRGVPVNVMFYAFSALCWCAKSKTVHLQKIFSFSVEKRWLRKQLFA